MGGNEQGGEDAEVECPVCEPGNATVRAIRQAQLESADRHDLFVEELSTSTDRFATVTEWFGRGVMGAGSAAVGSEDRV